MKKLAFLTALICLAFVQAQAQGWSDAYSKALDAATKRDWQAARAMFKDAAALRPEDQSDPTNLPGPVTEPRRWRDGSPYSPNFGAAYCQFHYAIEVSKDRVADLKVAASEFELLLAKGQTSPETYYFLSQTYSQLRDVQKFNALSEKFAKDAPSLKWRVDDSFLAPEEKGAIASLLPKTAESQKGGPQQVDSGGVKTTVIKATDINDRGTANTAIGAPPATGEAGSLAGRVPVKATKYALVIGNSESAMQDARLSFAASDALFVRETLIQNAGYAEENIDVVANASAAQMSASIKALADRLPEDATVLIYFTGAGYDIDGKDYYAGVDATSPQDSAHMVAVSDVYRAFLAKGASIFCFNQANRLMTAGLYFGKEVPLFGRISQAQATIPGQKINSLVSDGKEIGAYTYAFANILKDFRSNQVPIMEFAWQVFYEMRQGGGPQSPTLPVLTVLSADARF
ncbi:MAG TPA: caspase family protein [Fimbriimonadaceae bacterium]|nr:caspase family protein [Fimbriimonadaceae bacterium]